MPINYLLVGSFTAAALVEILAPLLLAIFLARRFQGRWRYWIYGVLVFLLSQGVTRIPLMIFLQTRPGFQEALREPVWYWLFLGAAAFTAGLFEEGGRWLAFRFAVPPADRHWRTALMLGAGHGGLESMGVGLVVLLNLVGYLAIMLLPPETFGGAHQVEMAREQFQKLSGWEPLLSAWERLGTLAVQVAFTMLVLQAFLRNGRWWWYALAAHTVVDFTAVAVLGLVSKAWGMHAGWVVTEGLVAVYALLSLWLIAALRPHPEKTVAPEEPPGAKEDHPGPESRSGFQPDSASASG